MERMTAMTNNVILREIHRDNKAINRNLQRLAIIGLMGLLGKCAKEANENNDTAGKKLVKTGVLLVALSEIILLLGDFIDYKKEKNI